jgi:hypothetical protein
VLQRHVDGAKTEAERSPCNTSGACAHCSSFWSLFFLAKIENTRADIIKTLYVILNEYDELKDFVKALISRPTNPPKVYTFLFNALTGRN